MCGERVAFPTGKVGIGFTINNAAPIYVSAEGPKGLQLAGRSADGVILGTGFDLNVYNWAKRKIREGAAQAGRNENDIKIIAAGMLCVNRMAIEQERLCAIELPIAPTTIFASPSKPYHRRKARRLKMFMAGFDVMKPMEERVDPEIVNDYLIQRFSIAGNVKECIERIEELKAACVDKHLMLTPGAHRLH